MGVIKTLAIGACLVVSGMAGYHVGSTYSREGAVHLNIQSPRQHDVNYMREEWHEFPDELKKSLVLQTLKSMSNDELYRAGKDIIIYRLNTVKGVTKPVSRDNIADVYVMLKKYSEVGK